MSGHQYVHRSTRAELCALLEIDEHAQPGCTDAACPHPPTATTRVRGGRYRSSETGSPQRSTARDENCCRNGARRTIPATLAATQLDELLRAVAFLHQQVADREVDIRLEIVGDGSRRAAWEGLAAQLGVQERVVFHGFVTEDALLDAYARCDVFCMPGTAELQSLATMEAMAAGKPVIAADAMALPHLVQPGRNGWLYPPGDVPALAGHLLCLLTDPDSCSRMGAASRQLIAEHTLDRTLGTFESLYHQAVGHRDAAPLAPSETAAA